jgi:hypothetical protein
MKYRVMASRCCGGEAAVRWTMSRWRGFSSMALVGEVEVEGASRCGVKGGRGVVESMVTMTWSWTTCGHARGRPSLGRCYGCDERGCDHVRVENGRRRACAGTTLHVRVHMDTGVVEAWLGRSWVDGEEASA